MKQNQFGFGLVEVILLLVITLFMAAGIWFVFANATIETEEGQDASQTEEAAEVLRLEDEAELMARDDVRQEHAVTMASRLFVIASLGDSELPNNQMGLDQLQKTADGYDVQDPLTNSKYLYEIDQTRMQPGEAAFAVNATCDNKVEGSEGVGLIVRSEFDSVAVAIKLESAGFACEASL